MWKLRLVAWGVALGFLGGLLSGYASATPISVVNYSFETPVLADDADSQTVTGWNTVTVWRCIVNPTGTEMTGADGNGTPLGGDGANIVYLHQGAGSTVAGRIFAGTPALTELGTYTLTVAVGSMSTALSYGYNIKVYGTPGEGIYSSDGSDLTPGQLVDRTVSWTITDPADVGYMVLVSLETHCNSGSVTGHTVFDNVRLDFTPVPEPSSMILLSIGCIGCIMRKRR